MRKERRRWDVPARRVLVGRENGPPRSPRHRNRNIGQRPRVSKRASEPAAANRKAARDERDGREDSNRAGAGRRERTGRNCQFARAIGSDCVEGRVRSAAVASRTLGDERGSMRLRLRRIEREFVAAAEFRCETLTASTGSPAELVSEWMDTFWWETRPLRAPAIEGRPQSR